MQINILGIRGLPASHGGFETFAEKLSLYLIDKGHTVRVYCQEEHVQNGKTYWIDSWQGIERIHIVPKSKGPIGTIEFDFLSVKDVIDRPGTDLVLGYNTAFLNIIQRFKGRKTVINMDGIEWKRAKWNFLAKVWFFCNEIIGLNINSKAIADHPEIKNHLKYRGFKDCTVIPYGADKILNSDENNLSAFNIEKNKYLISIARIEPENSILEIVTAFSNVKTDHKLVILGKFDESNDYHNKVIAAANENVIFPGAIYDKEIVNSLREYCLCYLHGHQVGGTNPSLVEALGASNVVIAHDNKFNRWVAGPEQLYFSNVDELLKILNYVISDDFDSTDYKDHAQERFLNNFTWEKVLIEYENILS